MAIYNDIFRLLKVEEAVSIPISNIVDNFFSLFFGNEVDKMSSNKKVYFSNYLKDFDKCVFSHFLKVFDKLSSFIHDMLNFCKREI